jgi:hypothetical protein
MSEAIIINCPVCRAKLRLRGGVLDKATVPCPKCGTTLDVPNPELPSVPTPQSSPLAPARKTSQPPASKPRSTSSSSANPYRKRTKSADEIPDPYGTDPYGADDSGDLFSDGPADDLSSNGSEVDPYGFPIALPPRKKSRSGSASTAKEFAETESLRAGSTRRGGFFSWVGYGLLAAIAGIILQSLLGFTNHLWPLLIATIVTGSMVGTAVRYAAGENNGWGPGSVAVLIAAFAIFAGRVGAFSLSPDVDKFLGIPEAPLTPKEAEARVVAETAEPYLIADIADEVEYDDDFLTSENIDEDDVADFWLEHEDEEDPAKRYLPAVWSEATHRWNRNSPEQKETIRKSKETELRGNYGIMSDDIVQQKIDNATTDSGMINEIANSLYEDPEWLKQAGISENQIDDYFENVDFEDDSTGESQHMPVVWAEAQRRWEELSPEEKQARLKETSDNLRGELVFSADDAKAVENISKVVRIFLIIIGAFVTLFWGIGSLICSGSALVSAFKIASGMNAAK